MAQTGKSRDKQLPDKKGPPSPQRGMPTGSGIQRNTGSKVPGEINGHPQTDPSNVRKKEARSRTGSSTSTSAKIETRWVKPSGARPTTIKSKPNTLASNPSFLKPTSLAPAAAPDKQQRSSWISGRPEGSAFTPIPAYPTTTQSHINGTGTGRQKTRSSYEQLLAKVAELNVQAITLERIKQYNNAQQLILQRSDSDSDSDDEELTHYFLKKEKEELEGKNNFLQGFKEELDQREEELGQIKKDLEKNLDIINQERNKLEESKNDFKTQKENMRKLLQEESHTLDERNKQLDERNKQLDEREQLLQQKAESTATPVPITTGATPIAGDTQTKENLAQVIASMRTELDEKNKALEAQNRELMKMKGNMEASRNASEEIIQNNTLTKKICADFRFFDRSIIFKLNLHCIANYIHSIIIQREKYTYTDIIATVNDLLEENFVKLTNLMISEGIEKPVEITKNLLCSIVKAAIPGINEEALQATVNYLPQPLSHPVGGFSINPQFLQGGVTTSQQEDIIKYYEKMQEVLLMSQSEADKGQSPENLRAKLFQIIDEEINDSSTILHEIVKDRLQILRGLIAKNCPDKCCDDTLNLIPNTLTQIIDHIKDKGNSQEEQTEKEVQEIYNNFLEMLPREEGTTQSPYFSGGACGFGEPRSMTEKEQLSQSTGTSPFKDQEDSHKNDFNQLSDHPTYMPSQHQTSPTNSFTQGTPSTSLSEESPEAQNAAIRKHLKKTLNFDDTSIEQAMNDMTDEKRSDILINIALEQSTQEYQQTRTYYPEPSRMTVPSYAKGGASPDAPQTTESPRSVSSCSKGQYEKIFHPHFTNNLDYDPSYYEQAESTSHSGDEYGSRDSNPMTDYKQTEPTSYSGDEYDSRDSNPMTDDKQPEPTSYSGDEYGSSDSNQTTDDEQLDKSTGASSYKGQEFNQYADISQYPLQIEELIPYIRDHLLQSIIEDANSNNKFDVATQLENCKQELNNLNLDEISAGRETIIEKFNNIQFNIYKTMHNITVVEACELLEGFLQALQGEQSQTTGANPPYVEPDPPVISISQSSAAQRRMSYVDNEANNSSQPTTLSKPELCDQETSQSHITDTEYSTHKKKSDSAPSDNDTVVVKKKQPASQSQTFFDYTVNTLPSQITALVQPPTDRASTYYSGQKDSSPTLPTFYKRSDSEYSDCVEESSSIAAGDDVRQANLVI